MPPAHPAAPPRLPIDPLLPELCARLKEAGCAVLPAPPGAGKTTRVPPALLALYPRGRLLMLEPRRLAARAAAQRMADERGEALGHTQGYRMRGESALSKATRIEVITEGVLTRLLQSDPELPGVACIIFDEFHERSLQADLGLALSWEVRQTLRPDLGIVVMSATLDAQPVADLLGGAPVLTAEGRSYPVEISHLSAPRPKSERLEPFVARHIETCLDDAEGSLLCFLPGEAEIRRTAAALTVPSGVDVLPLYGALSFAAQRRALAPAPRRKGILATSIAETSLTIEDIRIVVDAGLARRSRFDPGSGFSRLVTERVTQAEAAQLEGGEK